MVRFLLARPIAVGMTFLALAVFSIIVFRLLPVSLLPPIDVPQIVVRASYPNASPEAVEQNVLAPIREGLATLNGLEGLDSRAGSETGTVTLRFAHGTAMDLAYIETNEKNRPHYRRPAQWPPPAPGDPDQYQRYPRGASTGSAQRRHFPHRSQPAGGKRA